MLDLDNASSYSTLGVFTSSSCGPDMQESDDVILIEDEKDASIPDDPDAGAREDAGSLASIARSCPSPANTPGARPPSTTAAPHALSRVVSSRASVSVRRTVKLDHLETQEEDHIAHGTVGSMSPTHSRGVGGAQHSLEDYSVVVG